MRRLSTLAILPALALALCAVPALARPETGAGEAVLVSFPQPGLTPTQLGVVVNDDPDSVALAEYYRSRRGIPDDNLIHVRFARDRATLSEDEFARVKLAVDRATPPHVQAFALTWARPWRVDCMSITAAFAFGFDKDYCASECKPTQPSAYFNSGASQPYAAHRIRPAMSLAAGSLDAAKRLVDRGVAADGKNPAGTAYLVSTPDPQRNVRAASYDKTRTLMRAIIPTQIVKAEAIRDRRDIMFYFTGLARVPHIETNTYLPGAMADHLTSAGGALFGQGQMSILRWIDAGATGSYGAVTEPCNFPQKFPLPAIAMAHYLQGETLIEAYWKSVAMPGQGIFVGEPLARPFAGVRAESGNGTLRIRARAIEPGLYAVQRSASNRPVPGNWPVAHRLGREGHHAEQGRAWLLSVRAPRAGLSRAACGCRAPTRWREVQCRKRPL
jgi:uncharacterized protein (TIGR03790 family)